MSLITLSHVSHYSVTISLITKFQTLLLSIHKFGVMRFEVMSHREKERTEAY